MQIIDEIAIDPVRARIHEEGWQSWSPTSVYAPHDAPLRPVSDRNRLLCYRPDVDPPRDRFWAEGLLGVDPGTGDGIRVYGTSDGIETVESISARVVDSRLVVSSNGDPEVVVDTSAPTLASALGRWADGFALRAGVSAIRPAPTIWCSWYTYFTSVTEADMVENIDAIDRIDLPVDVVQLDDGYQRAHGDWLSLSDRFASLEGVTDRIRATGRRAGIWLAPFLVFPDSELADRNSDWLLRDGAGAPVVAGHNWGRDCLVLDVTHPGAEGWLLEVGEAMRAMGFDFFKLDFLMAGALEGKRHQDMSALEAYGYGMRLLREAIGDAYLLGCGAPMLPSVGLVDAMRVSPDTGWKYEPPDGDMSQPATSAAMVTGRARAYQHGRWWVNDPDNLLLQPGVEHRKEWAAHVRAFGGLRGSSDRIANLDEWGLATTRELLAPPPTTPLVS